MSDPKPTYRDISNKPKLKLPPGSWDTHCHIFGPGNVFPYPADSSYKPADAGKEKLFAMHERMGIERCVIVHSAAHGFDLRATQDAMAAKNGAYLGVALLKPDAPDAEIRRLDGQGFRGVRFNFMAHLKPGAPVGDVIAFGKRLANFNWHLQIHPDPSQLGDMVPLLKQSAVPIVIDHMARIDASMGMNQPGFVNLLKLMEDDRFWVKVSGADRATKKGPPYADAALYARKLVTDFPDRVVWGTDFPHPNHQGPIPDDGKLVDLIAEMAPTEALRKKLMVENPVRLYRPKT